VSEGQCEEGQRPATGHEVPGGRILEGLLPGAEPPPTARAAVGAWLWFMDGACLDWLEHGDFDRHELVDLLLGTLLGSLAAATGAPVTSGPAPPPAE